MDALDMRVRLLEASSQIDAVLLHELCLSVSRSAAQQAARRVRETLSRTEDLFADGGTPELDALVASRVNGYLRALEHGESLGG